MEAVRAALKLAHGTIIAATRGKKGDAAARDEVPNHVVFFANPEEDG